MALDPVRYPFARLVDATHKMPWQGRMFGDNAEHPGFERVDVQESHTHFLLAGGSIELAEPPQAPKADPSLD